MTGRLLVFWVNPPTGWSVSDRRLTASDARQAVSDESRRVKFEVRAPTDALPDLVRVSGYALYGACDHPSGRCLYRQTW
jgi:hypothetical protein